MRSTVVGAGESPCPDRPVEVPSRGVPPSESVGFAVFAMLQRFFRVDCCRQCGIRGILAFSPVAGARRANGRAPAASCRAILHTMIAYVRAWGQGAPQVCGFRRSGARAGRRVHLQGVRCVNGGSRSVGKRALGSRRAPRRGESRALSGPAAPMPC
ncbi:hypothetical protein GCM10023405_06270 [Streptomonospora salina]